MKKITIKKIVLVNLALALVTPPLVVAGNLEPTAAPSDAASAVYNTDDLYNRLQSGAAGAKRTGAFTEPSAGPADSVGKTLEEIMAAAPVADNVNGAAQTDVINGKTFWGLRTDGTWGQKTGTGGGSATQALVPKSGWTTCYDTAGGVIGCAGTGQDGDKQKGLAVPSPRFTINMKDAVADGTVTDNLTGLIWLRNAKCNDTVGGVSKSTGTLTWANALTWSNNLASGQCGLTEGSVAGDWRLPNQKELLSLVNDQYMNPALSNTIGSAQWTSSNPFNGVYPGSYWSSSTQATAAKNYAWLFTSNQGTISADNKVNSYYVWPVRGGQ